MSEKSLINYAFDVLSGSEKALAFKDLFEKANALTGEELSADDIRSSMSKFYTELTIDGRFTCLGNNVWDLRSRHTFEEYHVDTDEIVADDEDDEEDEDQEEKSLLQQELGEESDDSDNMENESDDIDFDSKKTNSDSEEDF